jgi:D-aminopeptidase
VGREIDYTQVPSGWDEQPHATGSVLVIVATDAPLLPGQCKHLAQRATIGLARTGCVGHNGSGDVILAFATGNHINSTSNELINLKMIRNEDLDIFYEAVAEATEEAILNSLTRAETMLGYKNRVAYELPIERLREIMLKYRPH